MIDWDIVALLDYGQVKDLPDQLRLGYANLVLAMADNDPVKAAESYRELGIETVSNCENEQQELLRLAQTMFDTKLPPGVVMLQPFSEDSSIKKVGVQSFPEELFSVLRTVHLLRGLSVGLGINYSCAEQWRAIAEEALYDAGRLKVSHVIYKFMLVLFQVPIKRLKFVSGVPSEDYFGEIDWLEEEKSNSFLEDTFIGLPSFVMFTSSLVLI
ncbi:hypothetical protein POUND7_005690, partial [Theobroma cacao]